MKQGAMVNRIVMLLIAAAILLYFGGAAWKSLHDPYPTVQSYGYQMDETAEATGFVCRQETVLTGQGGIVRQLVGEGEKAARGQAVVAEYADETQEKRSAQIEDLEQQVSQLSYAVAASGDQQDSEALGRRVVSSMVELRSSVERGDFSSLESLTTDFKSAVYQQADRYGGTADLQGALADLQSQIDSLKAQSGQGASQVYAPEPGVFSGQVDGYEGLLTPDGLAALSPADLDALVDRAAPVPAGAVGKLITSSTWHFVCPLSEADAGRLTMGGTVTVRFSGDWSGDIDMTVDRVGAAEDGRASVALSTDRYLSMTTLLRRQTVDLVFASNTGIRVPTKAVRQDKDNVTGVYVQVGATAEFKPVTILDQGEDFYLVQAVVPENATAAEAKQALRAGDAVILPSREIWDGMVVD